MNLLLSTLILAILGALPAHADLGAGLVALGFRCKPLEIQSGLSCRGRLDPAIYPEEIAIFVPIIYEPTPDARLILHLHGNLGTRANGSTETFDDILETYKFGNLLSQTGRASILVVPFSKGKSDTFKERFKTAEGFHAFLDGLLAFLKSTGLIQSAKIHSLALTSHSGSYRAVANILKFETRINELYLFDALYNEIPTFAEFAARPAPSRFLSAFPPEGTLQGNQAVWLLLHPEKNPEDFNEALLPPNVTDDVLARVSVGFVLSDQNHWDTVLKYFPKFLLRSH